MPTWRIVFAFLALVVGVLAAVGQNWWTAAAMLLLIVSQGVGEWQRHRAEGSDPTTKQP